MLSFKDITFAISDLSDVSEIVPFIAWAAFAKKGPPYRTLGIFFLISGGIKLFTLITAEMNIHNLPAYHLLAFLEVAFVYSFYQQVNGKKTNWMVITVLLLLYAANTMVQNIQHTFNSNTWTLTSLVIMVMGLSYFYRLYNNEDDTRPLFIRPDFIITVGWLIYAAGSLFTYLLGTDVLSGDPNGFFKNAWIFQCVSNILKNLIMVYGFRLAKKI